MRLSTVLFFCLAIAAMHAASITRRTTKATPRKSVYDYLRSVRGKKSCASGTCPFWEKHGRSFLSLRCQAQEYQECVCLHRMCFSSCMFSREVCNQEMVSCLQQICPRCAPAGQASMCPVYNSMAVQVAQALSNFACYPCCANAAANGLRSNSTTTPSAFTINQPTAPANNAPVTGTIPSTNGGNTSNRPGNNTNAAGATNGAPRPSNTVNRPANAANRPVNAANRPANAANRPANAANRPANAVNAANRPSNAGNTINRPANSANAATRPSNTANRPSNAGNTINRPANSTNAATRPSNTVNRPANAGNRPANGNQGTSSTAATSPSGSNGNSATSVNQRVQKTKQTTPRAVPVRTSARTATKAQGNNRP